MRAFLLLAVAAIPATCATTTTAGAISCTMTGLSGSLSIACTQNKAPLFSATWWPGSFALTYQLNVGSDALTLIIQPTTAGHWKWQCASNGTETSGTI